MCIWQIKYKIIKIKQILKNVKTDNEKLKYLSVMVTNTNGIHEEIKRRISMGNACYYSLEKIFSSHLLSKKLKVNTYITGRIVWL